MMAFNGSSSSSTGIVPSLSPTPASPEPSVVPDMAVAEENQLLVNGEDLLSYFDSIPYDQLTLANADSCSLSPSLPALPSPLLSMFSKGGIACKAEKQDNVPAHPLRASAVAIAVPAALVAPPPPPPQQQPAVQSTPTSQAGAGTVSRADMNKLRIASMDAQLQVWFPQHVLRGDKEVYKQHRNAMIKAKNLSKEQRDRLAKLRRKELSCVYADQARQRRAKAHKQASSRATDLELRFATVQAELEALKAKVACCPTCACSITA